MASRSSSFLRPILHRRARRREGLRVNGSERAGERDPVLALAVGIRDDRRRVAEVLEEEAGVLTAASARRIV